MPPPTGLVLHCFPFNQTVVRSSKTTLRGAVLDVLHEAKA